jgi:Tol biopolymer transport system component
VKVRPDGSVKVLDFGLAKTVFAENQVTADSPTIMQLPTQMGVILGTAAYMPPEQARGKEVDKRADIWSFGVVLHEMLTGKGLFQGEDLTETLAAVVKTDPDLSAVPPRVKRLLTKCLQKDPKKRLRDIGDWADYLEEERATPAAVVGAQKRPTAWIAVCGVAVLALAGLGAIHFLKPRTGAGPVTHLPLVLPDGATTNALALSPDGQTLVVNPGRTLKVRPLGSDQFRELADTQRARAPFWSPDGRNIAFSGDGKLQYVSASGGPVQQLCSGISDSGTWNRDNVILITGSNFALLKGAAPGGGCSPLPGDPAISRRFPWFLPDGKHFLYRGAPAVPDIAAASKTGVYVASLEDPAAGRRLLPDDTNAVFTPGDSGGSGYLLFRRDRALVGQAFDAGTLEVSGEVFKIADNVSIDQSGRAMVAAAPNGVLVYGTGRSPATNQQIWLNRNGKQVMPPGPALDQTGLALSRDGRQIATTRGGTVPHIQLLDTASNSESRLTSDQLGGAAAVWSPDGKMLAFTGIDGNLYRRDASGSGEEELLVKSGNRKRASDWSRDGRFLLYTETDPRTQEDIWVLTNPGGKAGEGKAYPFQQTAEGESEAQFSPDGRWVAYETGSEVYVRPFPSGEGRWRVSVKGGIEPRWRGDGKELFYIGNGQSNPAILAAPVTAGAHGSFVAGTPVELFTQPFTLRAASLNEFSYDVAADGQRFLVLAKPDVQESIHVVTNWTQAIGVKK